MSDSEQQQFDNLAALIESTDLQIIQIDADLKVASAQQLQSLLNEKRTLLNSLKTTHMERIGILTSKKQVCETIVNSLEQTNNNLTVTEIFELNRKEVNAIYLSTIALGHADYRPQQRTSLEAIALQCPQNGGDAVYQARAMLGMVVTEEVDCEKVNKRSSSGSQNETLSTDDMLRIFPNPASGSFMVSWKEISTAELIIYDVSGKQIHKTSLNKGQNQIQLTNNLKGVFWYRISNEKETFSGKIILH